MTKKERYAAVFGALRAKMGRVQSELDFASPFQLLVAVMLSAQCTDRRVNMVTPALFSRFPDAQSMAGATFEEVFELVRSVSYPRTKAEHLLGAARMIMDEFGGEIPGTVEQLKRLPGVGQKTANVVAAIAFGEPVIAVDTHIFRVSRRLRLSEGKTVEAVEKDLTANIPAEERPDSHHYLLLHGRYVCTARKPRCGECPVSEWCREFASGMIKTTSKVPKGTVKVKTEGNGTRKVVNN